VTRSVAHGWGLGIVAVLSLLVAQHAMAAPVENHRIRGWTLAAENCSQCHVIGNGAQVGGDIGPAFTAVAAMPSTTGMALNVFLQSHHQRMPSLRPDRDEMDAVIDYILSLKAAEPTGR
jgi:mono/diheme cytochrome c family protein